MKRNRNSKKSAAEKFSRKNKCAQEMNRLVQKKEVGKINSHSEYDESQIS